MSLAKPGRSSALEHFRGAYAQTIEDHWNSLSPTASGWKVPLPKFTEAICRSLHSRFGDRRPSLKEVTQYLGTLRLDDLALAAACAEGHEPAWEEFVAKYRTVLRSAAVAIAGPSLGHDLADSLYAELYGIRGAIGTDQEASRRPLFDYFHGRSKLTTWLRAVLAQRHVDSLRTSRLSESLDVESEETGESLSASLPAPQSHPDDPDRSRLVQLLQSALIAVLGELDPRDRLRLTYYYAQDLTLAQIGRLMGEHEATVSRKLDRTRASLKSEVDASLRRQHQLSDAQIRLCFAYAQDQWQFDLISTLAAPSQVASEVSPSSKPNSHTSGGKEIEAPIPNAVSYRLKQE